MSAAEKVTVPGSWRAKMNLFLTLAMMGACLGGFAWVVSSTGTAMHDGALRTASSKGEVALVRDVIMRPVLSDNEDCILRAGTRIRDISDDPEHRMVRVSVVDDTHRDGTGGCGRKVGEIRFEDFGDYSDATHEVSSDGTVRYKPAH